MTRETDWINVTKPDGSKWISAPNNIKKLLGVESNETSIYSLINRMKSLENKVHWLESPQRQKEVISLLSQEETPRNYTWLKNRIPNLGFRDLDPLIENGSLLFKTKAGHRMFYVRDQ